MIRLCRLRYRRGRGAASRRADSRAGTSSWAWAMDRHLPTQAGAWRSGMTLSRRRLLRVGRGMFPIGIRRASGHHRRMTTEQPRATQSPRLLRRRATDRVIGGVAAGIADYLNIDPVLVRAVFVGLVIFGGAGLVLYLGAWLLIPVEGPRRVAAGAGPAALRTRCRRCCCSSRPAAFLVRRRRSVGRRASTSTRWVRRHPGARGGRHLPAAARRPATGRRPPRGIDRGRQRPAAAAPIGQRRSAVRRTNRGRGPHARRWAGTSPPRR